MQVLVMRGRGVWCLCVSGEKLITLAKTLMFSIMMGVILTQSTIRKEAKVFQYQHPKSCSINKSSMETLFLKKR